MTTSGTIAVIGTGVLNAQSSTSLIKDLPQGNTGKLMTHPGYNDADLDKLRKARLRASRDVEREALQAVKEVNQIELTNFGGLVATETSSS